MRKIIAALQVSLDGFDRRPERGARLGGFLGRPLRHHRQRRRVHPRCANVSGIRAVPARGAGQSEEHPAVHRQRHPLTLLEARPMKAGAVWLHYRVPRRQRGTVCRRLGGRPCSHTQRWRPGYGYRLTDERRACTGCSLVADHFDGAHPSLERPRHCPRCCVDRPVPGAPGLQAAKWAGGTAWVACNGTRRATL